MPARTRSTIRLRSQFGDGADDHDESPTQRPTSIDLFPKTGELDVQVVEVVVQHFQEVPD